MTWPAFSGPCDCAPEQRADAAARRPNPIGDESAKALERVVAIGHTPDVTKTKLLSNKAMSAFQNRPEELQSATSPKHQLHRRDFIKLAASASATAAAAVWKPLEMQAAAKLEPLPPGIKVSLQISTDA